jgi:hypothetical protein
MSAIGLFRPAATDPMLPVAERALFGALMVLTPVWLSGGK